MVEGMTEKKRKLISYIWGLRPGDRIIVEAITVFSGPLEATVEKVCFNGNDKDTISIKNGFIRELRVYYDISFIIKQG